jgi:hypothetical protein
LSSGDKYMDFHQAWSPGINTETGNKGDFTLMSWLR